ncbi:HK97 gp10 family phage protein [Anaerotignum sp. MB30-C6]|uniref:HK97 gp10 family phage protein n=1 Tax=Anaerotignum sp. MB30-C6 TaxID=3070814 RepID=UPI0027DDE517|nr:HK97 gp10 family phage protein [Anaerotignum sp. MB30-C6]WMI82094.1 HK97 gp10 family phage protein [Anaerotignum sp. MB30-C6]
MSINVDEMAAEIAEMLGEYQVEITKNIDASSKVVADQGAKKLKETSPRTPKGGDYAKSWKAEKTSENNIGDDPSYTIYNKDHYRLTHLLENGHATRNGGRTRAIKHIQPVEQTLIKEYEIAVEEAIENASK